MDAYPNPSETPTFASVFGDFYNGFAVRYNKHFVLGETGSGAGGDDVASKEAWVKQLANTDVSKYPCFKSTSWFEYSKSSVDFRVIQGQGAATIKQTLSNFAWCSLCASSDFGGPERGFKARSQGVFGNISSRSNQQQ